MRAPAFQFYADDFLAGTLELSQSEVGAYIRLLCHQWNRGSIPVEPEKLQRLAGGPVSDDVLSKFPAGEDGFRRNLRLEQERQKQTDFREKQRQKGLKSGASRRTAVQPRPNRGSIPATFRLEPEANSPSPSPINTPLPPEGDGELFGDPVEESFDAFWALYPKKEAKRDALKAWSKVPVCEIPAVRIDIQRRAGTSEWRKDGGKFVPLPATYLRGERWKDETSTTRSKEMTDEEILRKAQG